MNGIPLEKDFKYIPKAILDAGRKDLFAKVLSVITKSNPDDIVKNQYVLGPLDDDKWVVYHGPTFKLVTNASHSYNMFFDKLTGYNIRFGSTPDDDPTWCGLGPEILDLEVVTGYCPKINGSACRYCYKNNSSAPGKIMSFETFRRIIDTFPANLSQIAFGITGINSNPELKIMFEYCRENGIIPNVTLTGADLDDDNIEWLTKYAGAVAVSCYTSAEDLCYKTISRLHSYALERYGRDLHVNMHLLVSKDNMTHVEKVLSDIAAGKVDGLRSVVFLRIKPKGRAAAMDCSVPNEIYDRLVSYCVDHAISFGFDSCSAKSVIKSLDRIDRGQLAVCCEPCESSKFSSYINVDGQYWNCSFCEGNDSVMSPINVLKYDRAWQWWRSDALKAIRIKSDACKSSCPWYNLD